jgi:hypothetical protein
MYRTENDVRNNYSIFAYVFAATELFLPSRFLVEMGMHMQANRLMGRICELHR